MLYRFIVSNFKSFAENQEFNMFPNRRRDNFVNHIYDIETLPVLKETAIYGANGAGKSNLIKAIQFLKGVVTLQPNSNVKLNNLYYKKRFKLPVIAENEPISFLIEFGFNNNVYIYNIELDSEGIKKEQLFLSGKGAGKSIELYTRGKNSFKHPNIYISPDVTAILFRQIAANPSMPLIALNGSQHLVENEHLSNTYEWFQNRLNIFTENREILGLIDLFKQHNNVLDFVNNTFSKIGLNIQQTLLKDTDFEKWVEKVGEDEQGIISLMQENSRSISKMDHDTPILSITENQGQRIVTEMIFKQIGKNGYAGEMSVTEQSNGTKKLLTLVPALFNAIYSDNTIIIDEIDNGIHPMLLKQLLKYFGDNNNTKGQLIYTTHNTQLLNQKELLRADEIWFTEKVDGATKLYSLNDFKYHKTLSIENGYLDGRFGAIPFLGSLE